MNIANLSQQLKPIFRQFGINTAYLFGSRADGSAYSNSDYDLGLLIPNFNSSHHNYQYVSGLQAEIEKKLGTPVDIVLLQKAPIILRFQIINSGLLLYCTDHEFRTSFEDITLRDYLDFKPFLDQYDREVRETIKGGEFFVKPYPN